MTNNMRSRLERMKKAGMITSGSKLREEHADNNPVLFPGQEQLENTAAGPCCFREVVFPLSHRHGEVNLEEAKKLCGHQIALLSREDSLRKFQMKNALYLDLETTGLAGGTGTLPFLIGIGWQDGDSFRLRQYFLRRPSEERSILLHFSETARNFDTVISFNGKTFDLPLINSRSIMTGTGSQFPHFQNHFDLLHCARRLWKERLASCALTSLETAIIGYHRIGDIPGAEIPGVYFEYLRQGKTDRIKQVFEHNLWDIISMVALMGVIGRLDLNDISNIPENLHPADYFSLGKLMQNTGKAEEAIFLLKRGLDAKRNTGTTNDVNSSIRKKILIELGLLYRKRKEWNDSLQCWENLICLNNNDPFPLIETAKIYEHKLKDYNKALEITNIALESSIKRHQMSGRYHNNYNNDGSLIHELKHTQDRLKRKLLQPKGTVGTEEVCPFNNQP